MLEGDNLIHDEGREYKKFLKQAIDKLIHGNHGSSIEGMMMEESKSNNPIPH